ncbi:MAG TPA: GspE/PulE family protein [Candidatus Saccharimonadales bacterium]|nr:GspE/PulE family protein [Candidatus Saccharimonadales bacterium]
MAIDRQAEKFREGEEQSTKQRATLLGLAYADSRQLQSTPLLQGVLTLPEMYRDKMVPLRDEGENGSLVFAITVGTPQPILRSLREKYIDRNVQFVMISNPGFKEFMQRYDPPKEVHYQDVKIASAGDSDTLYDVSKTLDGVLADDILDYLITQADKLRASDIHFECARNYVRMRFRVDGALHVVAQLTHQKYYVVTGAIASRANIATHAATAQTGHMLYDFRNPDGTVRQLNMRIETVPTIYGQDAVVRLFNVDASMLYLDQLGLDDRQRKEIDEVITHPHGMLMVVGPTGSGKSTTLYSIINALNDPARKIITLEDPVEFAIEGVSQIPVASRQGGSFAENLRAVLRLDPDVIMVGEIRDIDTAKTAIQASVTGHLVLTTFHASDAATALTRMTDMIGQNPIFTNAIKMVIGQRLVRRLDEDTKVGYEPDEKTAEHIRKILSTLPEAIEKPNLDNITLYKPGQSDDNPFGYSGRMMIMEQMICDENIQELLRGDPSQLNPDVLQKSAVSHGMVTMEQDGLLKALQGHTTLEELYRVL